ncbi:hypothetical protein HGRIS_006829 [Hohenbuehelia grisea]|uniref:Phospholipid/glycerol acyltransferase domain-containing protein n=1 Tax=Hohenbuehelia grisea TaxID=104357 RepID=A0ABR3JAR8_9AGAR
MELQLVYRFLRRLSDWILDRYYSEVFVDGKENVPRHTPLIIAASHHNDILDIATLAATIPHRRHLSYWAKASLFINPISRTILLSSGTIPVRRNPNNIASQPAIDRKDPDGVVAAHDVPQVNTRSGKGQVDLFRDSTRALSRGRVIGVFPEGMSHTAPRNATIMPGAAWAGMNFVRSQRDLASKGDGAPEVLDLLIVPVGLVYSDKARYRSRVRVRYGTALSVSTFLNEAIASNTSNDMWDEDIERMAVKQLTAAIQTQLLEMTINAPDWDTLLAALMTREILWIDDTVPLRDVVPISQKLVDVFSMSSSTTSNTLMSARRALIKYRALLHYTGIDHASLLSVSPISLGNPVLSPFGLLLTLLRNIFMTLFHPRFLLFLPVFMLHLPLYPLGVFAGRKLAVHRRDAHTNALDAGPDGKGERKPEEEGQAQFKGIIPGAVAGVLYTGVAWVIVKCLVAFSRAPEEFWVRIIDAVVLLRLVDVLRKAGRAVDGRDGTLARIAGILFITWATGTILARWHDALIDGNYKQFKRVRTALKVVIAAWSPSWNDVLSDEIDAHYGRPPLPPRNPFLSKAAARAKAPEVPPSLLDNQGSLRASEELPQRRRAAARRLVRPLLQVRWEAVTALREFLVDEPAWAYLQENGASLP